jgi:nitroreductase
VLRNLSSALLTIPNIAQATTTGRAAENAASQILGNLGVKAAIAAALAKTAARSVAIALRGRSLSWSVAPFPTHKDVLRNLRRLSRAAVGKSWCRGGSDRGRLAKHTTRAARRSAHWLMRHDERNSAIAQGPRILGNLRVKAHRRGLAEVAGTNGT